MRHYPPRPTGPHTGRSPGRDRAAQHRFRLALLARAGGVCEASDCSVATDLRATHIIPIHRGGSYDPSNGRLLCRKHDLETDPYAR